MFCSSRALLATLLMGTALMLTAGEPPLNHAATLDERTFPTWRSYLALHETEFAWATIPWEPNLGRAIAKANAEDKPVLLWAECGHPLSNV